MSNFLLLAARFCTLQELGKEMSQLGIKPPTTECANISFHTVPPSSASSRHLRPMHSCLEYVESQMSRDIHHKNRAKEYGKAFIITMMSLKCIPHKVTTYKANHIGMFKLQRLWCIILCSHNHSIMGMSIKELTPKVRILVFVLWSSL